MIKENETLPQNPTNAHCAKDLFTPKCIDITLIYRYFIRVIFICRFVVRSLKTEADLISPQLFTSLFAMF